MAAPMRPAPINRVVATYDVAAYMVKTRPVACSARVFPVATCALNEQWRRHFDMLEQRRPPQLCAFSVQRFGSDRLSHQSSAGCHQQEEGEQHRNVKSDARDQKTDHLRTCRRIREHALVVALPRRVETKACASQHVVQMLVLWIANGDEARSAHGSRVLRRPVTVQVQ